MLKKICLIFCFLLCFMNCKTENEETKNKETKNIKGKNYELQIAPKQKSVLILFPCFPCDIENTKEEAGFLKGYDREGVTLLMMNLNQKLYLFENEKKVLAQLLNSILDNNKIKKENIYIGGFSSGGNVSFLLSNYLIKTKNDIQPKGVFAIDSPFDLEKLYVNAVEDIKKNTNQEAVEEGKFIIEMFDSSIGNPKDSLTNYKKFSPYLISCNSINNIEYLKNTKVRFYTEPALEYNKKVNNRTYEQLNAFQLEKANEALVKLGNTKSEFIKTTGRGMRANGDIHPHSWSIVERESLLNWILE